MKDSLAMACSGLCLVHCIAGPILLILGFGGVLSPWFADEWVHYFLLVPVVGLALLSMPHAYKRHQSYLPMLLVTIGISVMLASFVLPEQFEIWLVVPSALIIITAHFLNKWLLNKPITA